MPVPFSARGFGIGSKGLAAAIFAALLLLAGMSSGNEENGDRRFLEGLRQRRLFELARTYCDQRLRDPRLPPARRAELSIEQSLTLAEWAINSPPGEREPLWRESWQVTEDFLRQHPDAPQAVLVRLQGALGLLARGELARQEAQVVADDLPLLEEARTWLRQAIDALQELDARLAAAIRERAMPGRSPAAPDGFPPLSSDELASIQRNVQYELARAFRNQGQSYAADSADRANSLTQAIRMLDPLTKLPVEHPLAWRSRIDEIVCLRLLSDYAAAGRKIEALLAGEPPAEVLFRGRAEKIRLALAEKRWNDAMAVIALGNEAGGAASADLDYAWIETYLAAWRAAIDTKDPAAASSWQTKASEMVQRIAQHHGPYWTRRAEMLLAGYVREAPQTSNLALQVRAAESSYRSGQLEDAVAAYDRAQATALAQGDAAEAFDLGYIAATIEHRRDRHAEALQRYRRLALEMPTQPKAPEAHQLACHHAAQLARQAPRGLDGYLELLQEHIRTWPQAASADDARWRLGSLREAQGDWQGAIAAYRETSPGNPQFGRAVEAVSRCYQAWFDQRRAAGEATDQIASEAAAWLESIVAGPQRRLPERWSPAARTAALAAARLWLNETTTGFARAEQLLTAALKGTADAPPDWQAAARSLLVFALAGQGRHREAMQALEQMSAGSAQELLALVAGLSRVARSARPELRAELAGLQLTAIEQIQPRRSQLAPAEQRALDFAHAQSLADAGRVEEAMNAFDRLARAYPRDGDIQEAHASLLLAGSDRGSLEKSLAKWREIEAKAAPASQRWFRAKYEVAALHYRLGNKQQAARMIQLLQVLHPDLGGPELKRKFLELLALAAK